MDSGAGGGGGVTAILVPYRHLRDTEMELVSLNNSSNPSPRARASPGEGPLRPKEPPPHEEHDDAAERRKYKADLEEAKSQENAKLQAALQEVQQQYKETKETLVKERGSQEGRRDSSSY